MSTAEAPPAHRPLRPTRERSFGLDVARALAAVGVLVTHVAFATGVVNPQRWSSPLRDVLPRLDVGVTVFFVLSGLLVARPFVRRTLHSAPAGDVRRYGLRRLSRVYPAYWVVLAVVMITFGGGSTAEIVADVLLVHIYVPAWAIGPITQSWTLATEIAFYAFVPAWFWAANKVLDRRGTSDPARRFTALAWGLVSWFVVAFIWRGGVVVFTDTFDFTAVGAVDTRGALLTWLPNHLDAFGVGVGLALWLESGRARPMSLAWRLGSYLVAAAALWFVSVGLDLPPVFTGFDGPQTHARHLLFLVIAAGIVAPSALATSAGADLGDKAGAALRQRAAWKPPASLARLATGAALASYGVYLWHQWVTDELFSVRGLTEFQAPFPSVFAFVLLGSTALAAITYWFVERPATTATLGIGGGTPSIKPRQLGPQPQLDGLRGLAILAVLGTHVVFLDSGSDQWALRGGFLGVDIFLGLSAFLIAAVLLRELDDTAARTGEPSIDGRDFARRRARRLYPPLVLFLAIEGVVAVLLGTRFGEQVQQSILALTFTANWQLSWGSQPPFELVHLWSLSLEAQFYLWMAGGLYLWRHRLGRSDRVVAWLTLAAVAVCLWRLWLYRNGVELEALYERTDARADSMLLGVAAALIWRSRLASDRAIRAVGAGAAVVLLGALVIATPTSPWLFEGGFTVIAACAAAVVAAAATAHGTVAKVSGWSPLRGVGAISYSLYLWHLPIYLWTVRALPDAALWTKALIAISASVGAAVVSYRLVEVRVLA
ncbi:MAG: acyltransferase family protein, partial [Microthrixaceae bacterium]